MYKRSRGVQSLISWNKSSWYIVGRAKLELDMTGVLVWRPNHLPMLRPHFLAVSGSPKLKLSKIVEKKSVNVEGKIRCQVQPGFIYRIFFF